MAVKIRLARRGRKKKAMYDVVIADARAPRDGRFIEKIGVYDPNTDPAFIKIDNDKAFDWLMKGALPTDTVKAMLSYRGLMYKKHLQIGVVKGAITQEEADKKLEAWLQEKNAKIEGKADQLAKAKADAKKQKLEAEAKVSAARAEALAAKKAEAEAAAAPAPEEAAVEEKAEEEATEPKAEEAPAKEAPVKEEEKDSAPEEAKAEEKKEEPKAEAPKAEEKKEEPKAEAPKTEEKKADEAEEEKKEEK